MFVVNKDLGLIDLADRCGGGRGIAARGWALIAIAGCE